MRGKLHLKAQFISGGLEEDRPRSESITVSHLCNHTCQRSGTVRIMLGRCDDCVHRVCRELWKNWRCSTPSRATRQLEGAASETCPQPLTTCRTLLATLPVIRRKDSHMCVGSKQSGFCDILEVCSCALHGGELPAIRVKQLSQQWWQRVVPSPLACPVFPLETAAQPTMTGIAVCSWWASNQPRQLCTRKVRNSRA